MHLQLYFIHSLSITLYIKHTCNFILCCFLRLVLFFKTYMYLSIFYNLQENDLKRVFLFALQVLYEIERQPSPLSRETTAVLNRLLSITESVLCWEFTPKLSKYLTVLEFVVRNKFLFHSM